MATNYYLKDQEKAKVGLDISIDKEQAQLPLYRRGGGGREANFLLTRNEWMSVQSMNKCRSVP